MCRFREGHWRRRNGAKLSEVEHLHAVIGCFADDERVIGEGLDASPRRVDGAGGQVSEVHGRAWVRYIHEGRTRRPADQCVLTTGEWVGPAPDVVAGTAPDLSVRQERHQVDVTARIARGRAVAARNTRR